MFVKFVYEMLYVAPVAGPLLLYDAQYRDFFRRFTHLKYSGGVVITTVELTFVALT